jgi:SAM-dependent methyltransferase
MVALNGGSVKGATVAARDAMEFINEQDEATLQRFVERLEFRGRDPTFMAYREAYVEKMALAPNAVVLDLGCGTGVVARALAARPGFSGRVIGIEQSPAFVEVARGFAEEEGIGERVEFRVGDVHALDVDDMRVDAVIAHTTISHVTDPLGVLKEAARVFARAALSQRSMATTRHGPSATAITPSQRRWRKRSSPRWCPSRA